MAPAEEPEAAAFRTTSWCAASWQSSTPRRSFPIPDSRPLKQGKEAS